MSIGSERLVRHRRPEVGAPDADVHHMSNATVAAHAVRKCAHRVEHLVDGGDHVLAVDLERRPTRHSQRDVPDRTILGDVDVLTSEHGVAPLLDAGRRRELEQRVEHRLVDGGLRPVDTQVPGGGDVALGTAGVGSEHGRQIGGAGQVGERLDGDRRRVHTHRTVSNEPVPVDRARVERIAAPVHLGELRWSER